MNLYWEQVWEERIIFALLVLLAIVALGLVAIGLWKLAKV